jgi:hypothetical protein
MIRVYYAIGLCEELADAEALRYFQVWCNREIYSDGYVYIPTKSLRFDPGWYRVDGTPCLIDDVPKRFRALNLLLT